MGFVIYACLNRFDEIYRFKDPNKSDRWRLGDLQTSVSAKLRIANPILGRFPLFQRTFPGCIRQPQMEHGWNYMDPFSM